MFALTQLIYGYPWSPSVFVSSAITTVVHHNTAPDFLDEVIYRVSEIVQALACSSIESLVDRIVILSAIVHSFIQLPLHIFFDELY